MSLWNGGKGFRDDYEKRILSSLDMRQLSRDGRIRSPDEKPILAEPKPAESEPLPKSIAKQPKEEPKPSPAETLPTQKETKTKGKDLKTKSDNKDLATTDDDYEFENPHKETSVVKEPEIDPAKLKEMKREEEIAKAKLAAERKKKLAEKAAAKAALKAQKEAEKKLKVTSLLIWFFFLFRFSHASLCHAMRKKIKKTTIIRLIIICVGSINFSFMSLFGSIYLSLFSDISTCETVCESLWKQFMTCP
jgi:hypothetical protein